MADDIYTITRLADELQKTRQNVRRRIKKLDIKALNEDTRVYQTEPLEYDKVTYLKLAESFGISVCNTNDIANDIVKDELIQVLKDQLQVANEEKKELRKLLDQQQQLTLQTNQQIQHLQLEETKETEKKLEAFEEKEAKKGFFNRWFGS